MRVSTRSSLTYHVQNIWEFLPNHLDTAIMFVVVSCLPRQGYSRLRIRVRVRCFLPRTVTVPFQHKLLSVPLSSCCAATSGFRTTTQALRFYVAESWFGPLAVGRCRFQAVALEAPTGRGQTSGASSHGPCRHLKGFFPRVQLGNISPAVVCPCRRIRTQSNHPSRIVECRPQRWIRGHD